MLVFPAKAGNSADSRFRGNDVTMKEEQNEISS